nr:trans-4-hydroxy-L-proline dehydratase activase [uncultured Clostridium sp.]
MRKPLIVSIQKYSVHDGDGIRTTVFFKGCMLNCWWCHNPESQKYTPEFMFNQDLCKGCGYCKKYCPNDAIVISREGIAVTDADKCHLCGICLDYCPYNNREIVGTEYTVQELMKIIDKDARFYEDSGGGVTLSGGEVMTQDMDFLEELCRCLKERDYHINIDTCGYAPTGNFARLLPYVNTFLYDIKTLDNGMHIKYMGQSNDLILSNLEYLADHCADINIRIPVVEPVNSDEDTINTIIVYLKERIGIVKVNLLPYHNTGSSKYEKLGRQYLASELRSPSGEHMEKLKAMFEEQGFINVKIGG